MNDTSYSIKSLADHWAVSYHTVYRLVESGKIKSFKIGGVVRISADEVRRIENNEERNTPHD